MTKVYAVEHIHACYDMTTTKHSNYSALAQTGQRDPGNSKGAGIGMMQDKRDPTTGARHRIHVKTEPKRDPNDQVFLIF